MIARSLLCTILAVLCASAGPEAQSATREPGKPRPTEVTTDHLKIRYANDVVALPGETASLTVEIEPRPGMHVYAPGADDYQVITVTFDKHSSIQAGPIKYPPSELYLFAPLNEQIPVYQKPFKLAADATVANTTGTLTLKGRLEYQACDDKLCFAPVEVPLSWTISR